MLLRRVWPSRPAFENSFNDFDLLRREMLRVFDSLARTDGNSDLPSGVFPPMNVGQDDNGYYLRAEIPGISLEDLCVSSLRNRVTISGKREIPKEQGSVSYHRQERPEGSFSRTFTLPGEVDSDRVEARYSDGVLTIQLPKAEAAKPRQITVSA